MVVGARGQQRMWPSYRTLNTGIDMSKNHSIKPHGGILVNRINKVNSTGLFSITISEDLANDVENIADGIFSPLEGFLGKQDYESIISRGRLENDLAWTIPIILDVDKQTASKMKESGDILLKIHKELELQCYTLRKHILLIKKKLHKESMELSIPHIQALQRQCQ